MNVGYRWTLAAILWASLTVACSWPWEQAPTPEPEPIPTAAPTDTPTPSPAPTSTPMPTPTQADPAATEAIAGRWEGTALVLGMEMMVALNIADGSPGGATIDIPQQGVHGLPLRTVRYNPPLVNFEIRSGELAADFQGTVQGDTISGDFSQSGVSGSFTLARVDAPVGAHPDGDPPPYRDEEVVFHNGDIILTGTLTLPPGDGPHPAVVLISGSGAQNRDGELFGFRMFGVMADHLTRQGIAVLRYDDRGVGGSTGDVNQATTADFADDAAAAVDLLQARPDINREQIGLLGHSEGGMVAPLAARQSDHVSFVVLMASPGLPGEELSHNHLELIAPTNGLSAAQLAERREVERRAFQSVRSGQGFAELEEELRRQLRISLENLPEAERRAIPDEDQYINVQAQMALAYLRTPWFRFFLDHDPAESLRQMTVPVLAVFAELDRQVQPEINRRAIEQALAQSGNSDVSTETLPRANHLFQQADTGNPNEYPHLDKEFVPGFLNLISNWILERVDTAPSAP